MDKKAIKEELSNIFKLMKACVDRDYLNKLAEEKGLTDTVAQIKKANKMDEDFEDVIGKIIQAGADGGTVFKTIQAYDSSYKEASKKNPRPKTDKTQTEAIKRLMEQKGKGKDTGTSKSDKTFYHRGVVQWLKEKFIPGGSVVFKEVGTTDEEGKKKKKKVDVFVDKEGRDIFYLGDIDFDKRARSLVKGKSMRGYEEEDLKSMVLFHTFFEQPKGGVPKGITRLKRSIEDASNDDRLPLKADATLANVLKDNYKDVIKYINTGLRSPVKEDELAVEKDNVDKHKPVLENIEGLLKDDRKLEKELEKRMKLNKEDMKDLSPAEKSKKLDELKDSLDEQKKKVELQYKKDLDKYESMERKMKDQGYEKSGPATVPKYQVQLRLTEDGETKKDIDVDDVQDQRALVEEALGGKQMVEDFGKYVKENAKDFTAKVYDQIIQDEELSFKNVEQLKKVMKDQGLEGGVSKYKSADEEIRQLIVDYAKDRDDLAIFTRLAKRDKLPSRLKRVFDKMRTETEKISDSDIKKLWARVQQRGKKSSSYLTNKVSGVVDYLETIIERI